MDTKLNILVVDDDADIRSLVESLLERNGMSVTSARSAAEAETIMERTPIDLMVLDLMMPGEDGLTFCRRVRDRSGVPIIMLTALSEDVDRILGLELGADDYLPKPFNPRELLARIKTVMRRAPNISPGESNLQNASFSFGRYMLCADRRALVRDDGQDIELTSGEFALLLALVERAPRVLTRDQLLDLSRRAAANPFDRSIDSQISRIRRKIEIDPKRPEYIKTVRSLGYAFAQEVRRAARA